MEKKESADDHINQVKKLIKRMPDDLPQTVSIQIGAPRGSQSFGSSAIADDILLNRLKEGVPDKGNDTPALDINRGASSGFVEAFKGLVDHWVGYLVIVNTEFEDNGKHISNSGAVRVDNIAEVVRVLEVLLKR